MKFGNAKIVVLACGMLSLALASPPPLEGLRLSDSEINMRVEEAARNMPRSEVTDEMLRGLADDRMDSVDDENVKQKQASKRFFHSEPEPEPAHGWGAPPPPAHGGGHSGPQMGLVGPFAFQLGAYYNPYIPVPLNQGSSYAPPVYGSPAPQPYSVQKAPSYTTTAAPSYSTTAAPTYSTSYTTTTAAPSYSSSYGSSSYSAPASSYGNSYSPTPANPIILGYTASASYPSQSSGYGSSSSGYGSSSPY